MCISDWSSDVCSSDLALCEKPPLRIGLSATQKPIETMARLLMGSRGNSECPVDIRPRERPDRECLAPARSDSMSGRAGQTWAGGRKVEIGLATDGVNEGSTGIGLHIVNGRVIVAAGHPRDRDQKGRAQDCKTV